MSTINPIEEKRERDDGARNEEAPRPAEAGPKLAPCWDCDTPTPYEGHPESAQCPECCEANGFHGFRVFTGDDQRRALIASIPGPPVPPGTLRPCIECRVRECDEKRLQCSARCGAATRLRDGREKVVFEIKKEDSVIQLRSRSDDWGVKFLRIPHVHDADLEGHIGVAADTAVALARALTQLCAERGWDGPKADVGGDVDEAAAALLAEHAPGEPS